MKNGNLYTEDMMEEGGSGDMTRARRVLVTYTKYINNMCTRQTGHNRYFKYENFKPQR